jgi:hypothetical protein
VLVVEVGRRRGSEQVGAVVVVVAEVDVDMVVMAGVKVEVEQVVVAARKAGSWVRWIHGACLLGGGRDGRRVGGDGTGALKGNPAYAWAKGTFGLNIN